MSTAPSRPVRTPVSFANQLTFSGGYVAFSGSNSITFSNTLATDAITGTANLIVNAATTLDVPLGGEGSLVLFSGTSTLSLTEADSYGGATTVNGGTLIVTGAAGAITASTGFTVNPGGILEVDDRASNTANRLYQFAPSGLTLNGGTLTILGFNGSGTSTEGFGAGVFLSAGNSTISTTAGTGGNIVQLQLSDLVRDPGATVNFQAPLTQTLTGADQILASLVTVAGINLSSGNVIPGATVTDGTTFAGNTSNYNLAEFNGTGVVAFTAYVPLLANGLNLPTDNVLVSSGTFANPGAILTDSVNSLLVVGNGINRERRQQRRP